MLTISPPPELEEQLRLEAHKRGVPAEELTVEALRVFLRSNGVPDNDGGDEAEAARLAAIDELMGMGADVNFSTEDLHRERREDAARDEAQYQRQFGKDTN